MLMYWKQNRLTRRILNDIEPSLEKTYLIELNLSAELEVFELETLLRLKGLVYVKTVERLHWQNSSLSRIIGCSTLKIVEHPESCSLKIPDVIDLSALDHLRCDTMIFPKPNAVTGELRNSNVEVLQIHDSDSFPLSSISTITFENLSTLEINITRRAQGPTLQLSDLTFTKLKTGNFVNFDRINNIKLPQIAELVLAMNSKDDCPPSIVNVKAPNLESLRLMTHNPICQIVELFTSDKLNSIALLGVTEKSLDIQGLNNVRHGNERLHLSNASKAFENLEFIQKFEYIKLTSDHETEYEVFHRLDCIFEDLRELWIELGPYCEDIPIIKAPYLERLSLNSFTEVLPLNVIPKHYSNITELKIYNNELIEDKVLPLKLPNLKLLGIYGSFLKDMNLDCDNLPWIMPKLEKLENEISVGDNNNKVLVNLPNSPFLKSLVFKLYPGRIEDYHSELHISNLPHLENVEVGGITELIFDERSSKSIKEICAEEGLAELKRVRALSLPSIKAISWSGSSEYEDILDEVLVPNELVKNFMLVQESDDES